MASDKGIPGTSKSFCFSANPFMTTSFTNLLSSPVDDGDESHRSSLLSGRVTGRSELGQPKFKLAQPSPLPISPPYFAMSELLDSPVLWNSSHIFPSPTTGAFPVQAFNWSSKLLNNQDDQNNYSDFFLQPQATNPTTSAAIPSATQQTWSFQLSSKPQDVERHGVSPDIASIQANSSNTQNNVGFQSDYGNYQQEAQRYRESRGSDDGYNWRKYGQKQVKASENPRSYYKCTYPNCPTKKIVERSSDGLITEIVYKGDHNHPKPQSTRRSSLSTSVSILTSNASQFSDAPSRETHDKLFPSHGIGHMDSAATPENSSISFDNGNLDQSSQSQKSREGYEEFDEDEPDAKRWKNEGENEEISAPGCRTVREPRVVVQTISDIDVLIDGYRWRKYGQKVVKGNPNPRSYYKCTYQGCPVRKHLERAAHDQRAVITTYEGRHTHDVPAARGSHSLSKPFPINADSNTRLPFSEPEANISSEILGFRNTLWNHTARAQNTESVVYPGAKEEPRDENLAFLESLLE